ncbi:MAG: hypothetical protein SGI87_14560 [Flavobacteriales bacterium]|nr:hypothetical protein [Flavobacteriales bacterium]
MNYFLKATYKTIFLLATQLLCGTSWSQEFAPSKWNAIKVQPLSLFDPLNPSIQFAFEHSILPSWTIQLQGGPIVPINMWYVCSDNSCVAPNHQGYRLGFEVRKYLQEKYYSPWHGLYVAAEVFYLENEYQYESLWANVVSRLEEEGELFLNENHRRFGVDKTALGLNVKLGHQLDTKFPVGLEIYAGLGIRKQSVTLTEYSPLLFENQEEVSDEIFQLDKSGHYYRLNIPIGISLTIQL